MPATETAFETLCATSQELVDYAMLCKANMGYSPAQRRVFAAIEQNGREMGRQLEHVKNQIDEAKADGLPAPEGHESGNVT